MTTLKTIFKAAEKFVTDNSPGILTGLGVAGTITTAILTGKAAYKSGLDLYANRLQLNDNGDPVAFLDPPSRKKQLEIVWKEFIPPAIAGIATITCIIAANHIGTRRTAAIAAAFKLSEQLTEEYKEKVIKTLGVQKEEKIRSELAAERMAKTPGSDLIIVAGSEVVFFDDLSGQYFKAEMETVRKAVNDINYKINNFYCASLSDFYDLVGMKRTSFSDEVGWNSDELLEVKYAGTLLDDQRPAIAISYNSVPIRGYDRCQ